MIAGGYGSILHKIKNKYLLFLIKKLYPPMPTLNTIPNNLLHNIQNLLFYNKMFILNIGSGSFKGCGSRLWNYKFINKTLNVDINPGPGVDMIQDAHNLTFEDEKFDTVIMQAVIEHLHSPSIAISEAYRVLKPGGFLYLEVPFLQGFHADPHDYQRFTIKGLECLTKNFKEIVYTGVSVGPICSIIWFIRDFISNITGIFIIDKILRFIFSWLLSPLRYLDYLFYSTKASKRLASEYFILVKK